MIGQTVSHYRILEQLGAGGMGVVYKAEHLKLGSHVALKFLSPHLLTQELARRRFVHEAEAASSLEHPNICTVYDIDETPDGQTYIVMPFYEGDTLQERIRSGPLGLDEAVAIVMQVAAGLAKAHDSGITHRDIKPGNILITNDGHAKILDFGLAKLSTQTRMTRTGTALGTVAYMSPEQASGEEVDQRSDVFSLGVVLYELLTGRPPFRGDNEASLIYAIVHRNTEPLVTYRGDLPEDAQRVIDRALAKKRNDRYASASELLADLTKLQLGQQVAAFKSQTRREYRRRLVLYTVIGVIVIGLGYAGLSRLLPRNGQAPAEEATVSQAMTVAVLPFTVRGGQEHADLGEGIADLMSTLLDGAGDLQSVDPQSVSGYTRQLEGALDPAHGRQVAANFGAGHFLLGDIMAVGERLHVNASLYESGGQVEPLATASVDGDADQVLALVEDLAFALLKDRMSRLPEFRFEIESITTRSFPAFKAYLLGWDRFRRDDPQTIEAFTQAVEADSTFALAWYRLAMELFWSWQEGELIRHAADQALRHSDELPRHGRLRIQAFRAFQYQNDEEAERLYRTILSNFPEDAEAWATFGFWQFRSAMRRCRSPSEARPALEKAVTLDPGSWQTFHHLRPVALFEREYDEVEVLSRRIWSDEPPVWIRAVLAFGTGDLAAQEDILAELNEVSDGLLFPSAIIVAGSTDDILRAQAVARLLAHSQRSDEVRAYGHILLAYQEAARGRWHAARRELDQAMTLSEAMVLEYGTLLATAPFLPVPEPYLRSLHDDLTAWNASDVPPSENPSTWLRLHDDMHTQLRVYLLGLLNVRLGEYAVALQHADELEQMAGPERVVALARDQAIGLRAQVAWQQGDAERAVSLFQQIELKPHHAQSTLGLAG